MKLSKYNTIIKIDDKNIVYNTYSRKYIIYKNEQEKYVNTLLNNLNNDKYNLKDAENLKKFIHNGMIIEDELDEVLRIKFNDNSAKFDNETFSLVIQPTLDCNFRCIYCYEEHKKSTIDNQTKDNIIKFIDKISRKSKNLKVAWFGGEPMLELDTIIDLTLTFKEICINNGCNYEATMTTNGYLFSNDNIDILQQLSINKIQITLDGTKECHDKKRPLYNGEGTFEKIIDNITKILNKNINITLRINVDEENYEYIDKLFDMLPKEKREYVNINMSNLFQNNGKLNLYNIYKSAINKGYKYYHIVNIYKKCEAFSKNACTIQPDGKIVPCSFAAEKGLHFGEIDCYGNINISNRAEYIKFQNITALNSEKCTSCIQLPMCMGGCTYSRYKNKDICNERRVDGLKLDEKIRLHYYNDLKHNNIEGNVII